MTVPTERVCPRCGEPAGTQRFCRSCGLNLIAQREIPTRAEWGAASGTPVSSPGVIDAVPGRGESVGDSSSTGAGSLPAGDVGSPAGGVPKAQGFGESAPGALAPAHKRVLAAVAAGVVVLLVSLVLLVVAVSGGGLSDSSTCSDWNRAGSRAKAAYVQHWTNRGDYEVQVGDIDFVCQEMTQNGGNDTLGDVVSGMIRTSTTGTSTVGTSTTGTSTVGTSTTGTSTTGTSTTGTSTVGTSTTGTSTTGTSTTGTSTVGTSTVGTSTTGTSYSSGVSARTTKPVNVRGSSTFRVG